MVLTLAAATGLVLSESLLHGLDIARGARLPWTIGPEEARLVIGQSMPAMMPLALDPVRARGVRIAFDLAVRGGPRLAVVIGDGVATVTRDAPPRAYDCRISAAPDAFLLVAFRRAPLWKVIARGGIRAGGRKPWLAPGSAAHRRPLTRCPSARPSAPAARVNTPSGQSVRRGEHARVLRGPPALPVRHCARPRDLPRKSRHVY
ncbi:hypothetical protein ACFQ2B_03120 [Streptomyces stramineus]